MKLANKFVFKITTITLALTAMFTMTSCDDDEKSFVPLLPTNGGDHVKAIQRTGGIVTTAYDWNFFYEGPRMEKAQGVIRDPESSIDLSYNYTSDIKYGEHELSLRNTNDQKVKIVLNGSNFIERMEIDKNIYEFQYNSGRLASWQKIIFENSFGQANQYKSSAKIYYENEDLKSIEYIGPDNIQVTTTFINDVRRNSNGLLPEAIAKEFGCLGFEHLYYAGLLGRSTGHLVKSLSVTHPKNIEKCYTLNFDYSVKGNNTVLCNYKTPSGEPVAVNYTY